MRNLYGLARLRPGVEISTARAEAVTLSRNLAATFPKTNHGVTAAILPVWQFHSAAPGLLMRPLRILMVISMLLLLIVCANVTNLLLARSVSRRKELSIRLALGAGAWRLSRQLLTEAGLLAGAAAGAGLLLASWLADALPALVPKINAPIALGFSLDGRVIAFTLLTCALAALLSGVLPALLWFRSDVNETLKQGGRSGSHGAQSHGTRTFWSSPKSPWPRSPLIGAGLFVRSFPESARSIPRGFDAEQVVLARFYESGMGMTAPQLQQFFLRLRDRMQTVPAVTDVSYADYAPLGTSGGLLRRSGCGRLYPGSRRVDERQPLPRLNRLLQPDAHSRVGRTRFYCQRSAQESVTEAEGRAVERCGRPKIRSRRTRRTKIRRQRTRKQ